MKKILFYLIFILYIIVLIKITIIRDGISFEVLFQNGKINMIPFIDLFLTFKKSQTSFIYLFIGNIICFIPIGIFIATKKKHSFILAIIVGLSVSISIEFFQYMFGNGISELDDILLNTLGVLIGYTVYIFTINKKMT